MFSKYNIIGLCGDFECGNIIECIKKSCPDKTFKLFFIRKLTEEVGTLLFNLAKNKLKENNENWNQTNEELLNITDHILKKIPQMSSKLKWSYDKFGKQKLSLSSKKLYNFLESNLNELKNDDNKTIYLIPDLIYNDEMEVIRKMGGIILFIEQKQYPIENSSLPEKKEEEEEENKNETKTTGSRKRKTTMNKTLKKGPKLRKNKRKKTQNILSFNEKIDGTVYDFKLLLGKNDNSERLINHFFNSKTFDTSVNSLRIEDCSVIPHPNFKLEKEKENENEIIKQKETSDTLENQKMKMNNTIPSESSMVQVAVA